MGNIDALTVEDILSAKKMKISSGETVSGKKYLEDAITAFDLKTCDYHTVFKLLTWIAKGQNADVILEDIRGFWQWIEAKYDK